VSLSRRTLMLLPLLAAMAVPAPAAAEIAAPAAKLVVTPDLLAKIDAAYLNRRLGRNLEESNATLRALLADQPQDPGLPWRLARGLHALGASQAGRDEKLKTFKEGAELLDAELARRPDDAEAHYWLGRLDGDQNEILKTLGLARAMRRELEAAIALAPGHADAHHYLGELLRRLPSLFGGDKQKAVAELEEAARLAPNEASHYPALAEAYLAVKDKARAAASARKTFSIKTPDDPGGYDLEVKNARDLLDKLGAN
jgi:tetratricopeptide (TPR) repeat protein